MRPEIPAALSVGAGRGAQSGDESEEGEIVLVHGSGKVKEVAQVSSSHSEGFEKHRCPSQRQPRRRAHWVFKVSDARQGRRGRLELAGSARV